MASQMQNDLHFSSRISHSFLCEFYSNTYRSIALEQIYSTSFEPNSIRASAGSRNPFESAGKKDKRRRQCANCPTPREFAAQRLTQSLCSKNQKCSTFKELSIGSSCVNYHQKLGTMHRLERDRVVVHFKEKTVAIF